MRHREPETDALPSSATPTSPVAAAAIRVSGADAHTTTIKMEDGDEITIKRAASSKNKITTISTHEDGKITIENHDHGADALTPAVEAVAPSPAPVARLPIIDF